MLDLHVLPRIRLLRNVIKYRYALLRIRLGVGRAVVSPNVLFVIGCGRSGTSILSRILGSHSDVHFLFEPLHLWAATDPRLDLTNLFTRNEPLAIVDETLYSADVKKRFDILFSVAKHKTLLEKTPHNALRISFLDNLVPNALYIHIVRCGIEVAESINLLATINASLIAGRESHNQWWGSNLSKWEALKRDGARIGFPLDEMGRLNTHLQKAAFEWLLTMIEVDKHRQVLNGRFLEVKYADLVCHPVNILESIVSFSGLRHDNEWMSNVSRSVRHNQSCNKEFEPLILPPKICELFNQYQFKYDFHRRAVPDVNNFVVTAGK